ncbi:MAG TPA: histone deacetylase family protein [Lysobacter sp.]|nr:histone deacetylase family protein [Lysobacter sp.]
MIVVQSPLHARHDGGMELHRGALVPSFESPDRVDHILRAVSGKWPCIEPRPHAEAELHTVHDPAYVEFLRTAYTRWQADGRDGSMLPSGFPARSLRQDRVPDGINGAMGYYAFDAGTPIVAGTWEAAFAAARCALTAAALVSEGARSAYALCRPPGHHAARSVYGGYCYLNNAALAAQALRDAGRARVAILDIDYHHGNGTQDIFWSRGDVHFTSIHGSPDTEYPYFLGYADETGVGEGAGCTRNFPLPRGTGWDTYAAALEEAMAGLRAFAPDALVVSLGVDAFEHDPISSFRLSSAHFADIGHRIAAAGWPTVLVQEGGYAVEDIGTNVVAVLSAFG